MRVFVTGGTGYVGRAVVEHLVDDGHEVTVLQRPGSLRRFHHPGTNTVDGDLFDKESLREGLRNHDAVVHLVGIIREHPRRGITMQRIHVEGTQNLVRATKANGIPRFLHMSALHTRPDATSSYHQSKWAAECIVREAVPAHTIFRPSVVFGKGGPGPEFVGQLVPLVKHGPIVPVIGHGQYKLQPVSIQTVAEAFSRALDVEASVGKTYELGGPAVITYIEILERIAGKLGKTLRTVHIPARLMEKLVPLLQRLPGFPLTTDQLTMLLEGNACNDGETAYRELKLQPIPFEVILS